MADNDKCTGVPIPCSYFVAKAEAIRHRGRSNSVTPTISTTADRSHAFDNLNGTSQGARVGDHADNISASQWDEFHRGHEGHMLCGTNMDRSVRTPAQYAPLLHLRRSESFSDRIETALGWGGTVYSTLSLPPTREAIMPDPIPLEDFQPDIYPMQNTRARLLKTKPFIPIVQTSNRLGFEKDQITQEQAGDMDALLDYDVAVDDVTGATVKEQRSGGVRKGVGEEGMKS